MFKRIGTPEYIYDFKFKAKGAKIIKCFNCKNIIGYKSDDMIKIKTSSVIVMNIEKIKCNKCGKTNKV